MAFFVGFLKDGVSFTRSFTRLRVKHDLETSKELQIKHQLNSALVRLANQGGVRQSTLSLGRFFRQDMAFESVFALDLASTCDRKPLFS